MYVAEVLGNEYACQLNSSLVSNEGMCKTLYEMSEEEYNFMELFH